MSGYGGGGHPPGSYGPGNRRDGGRGGGGQPHGGQHHASGDNVAKLWPDYLNDGYFDANGHLKIEYVSRERIEPLVKAMCQDRTGLTTHQVRRYFGHCRAIETRLKSSGATWTAVWPEVKKLDVAAADGFSKQSPKIPRLFHDFIRRNVERIKSEKDFLKGFLPHFEALVGFGQAHFRKDRG